MKKDNNWKRGNEKAIIINNDNTIDSERIENLCSHILSILEFPKKPLEWDEINERIKEVQAKIQISNALKLIMSSTGSVTKALEIVSGKPVSVYTIFQKIGVVDGFNRQFLESIHLKSGKQINFREVWLSNGTNEHRFVYAISLTPIERLEERFRQDLIKADIPIGKLIEKYKIECRREIFQISTIPVSHLNALNLSWNEINGVNSIPYRVYNIISKEKVLMSIIEFFSPMI